MMNLYTLIHLIVSNPEVIATYNTNEMTQQKFRDIHRILLSETMSHQDWIDSITFVIMNFLFFQKKRTEPSDIGFFTRIWNKSLSNESLNNIHKYFQMLVLEVIENIIQCYPEMRRQAVSAKKCC